MVAPTGVNKGAPQEPAATAGLVPAEAVTEDPAGPAGDLMEKVSAGPMTAEPSPAEAAAPEVTLTKPAAPEPAAAARPGEPAAEAAVPEAGQAETALPGAAAAGTAAAGTAPAGAEAAEVVPAEAELAGAGLPGTDADQEDRRREESRDVRPLAVMGIIIGVVALVGVAAGVLAMVTHGFKPKTVVTYRPAAVFGLRPGQCVNSGATSLSYTLVSCASPHDAEVFARFSLPAAAWPGSAAVRQQAGDGCASRLSGYLNPQLATIGLTQAYVYPNKEAWQAGQRIVVCEVSAGTGRLTGSVRAKR